MTGSTWFAVCPGSLVPNHWHDPALLELLGSRLNSTMINFVACKVVEAVRCRPSHGYPTPPESPNTEAKKPVAGLPPLASFIKAVVRKSRCHVPTLLASAVFLERLRSRLPNTAQGCPTTRHRCALAAIVIAAKYLNDSSPMNKHWARYSEFSLAEINLMEMQLLAIFNFDLRFDEAELIRVLQPLLQADAPEKASVRNSMPPIGVPRPLFPEPVPTTGDGRRDEVVSRGRHYSVDAAAFAAEETGEAGKQLTPAYQRTTTGAARPRGALPTPPPPVPPRPSLNHRISYPRHRRPGSTTPLSSPPPYLDGFTTLSSRGDRLSSRSSYSSSSTFSSTSSSSFGPQTPHTPLLELPYHLSHSPIPPIPIPPPKSALPALPSAAQSTNVHSTRASHHQLALSSLESVAPLSWSSSHGKSKKLSPALSASVEPFLARGVDHTLSTASAWPCLYYATGSGGGSATGEGEIDGAEPTHRRLRRRDVGERIHVRERFAQDELERTGRNLVTLGVGGGGIEVR
ncbi:hypothetical protein JCM11491_006879 [Sporobolomyces phaffii]